jgi:superfamily II DNA or RNA helicase
MADGFLCPVKIYSPQNILDPEAAGIPKSKGDYKQKELEEYTETVMLSGDVFETWRKLAQGKQTVVYPVSVKLSLEYCETFIDNGVAAAHIDANTPAKEREQILADFAATKITVLFQHSIVIEGVNIVGIEVVQFARPTSSIVTWFQAIGRSRRPAPGKEWALIIDHTATHALLPHPDDEIPWSLDATSLTQQGFGTLQCPECGHIYKMSQPDRDRGWSHCAGCQTKFSFEVQRGPGGRPRIKTVQTLPADFNELSLYQLDKPTMEFFEQKQQEEKELGYKSGWAAFKTVDACKEGKFAGGLQEFKEIAIRTGFKPGWGYYKWREVQEWRFG